MTQLLNILSVAILVLGFGFVIFWHELGHFLAAKAVGIKVEQFAVGMGQALLCWRKGIGLTVGSSAEKYRSLIATEFEKRKGLQQELKDTEATFPNSETELAIAKGLGLGETEYRLNWIPLGGYVKMLGQDDLEANVGANDPRAYNNKSIPARMLVVSAGVMMNILLAAIFFVALFTWGFKVSPPLVGTVAVNSPAQRAGILPGDRILSVNGNTVADFNKLQLNIVLLPEGTTVPVKILRDGLEREVMVKPEKLAAGGNILQFGFFPTPALRGVKPEAKMTLEQPELFVLPDVLAIKPGEVIFAIEGKQIRPELARQYDTPSQYAQLLTALDAKDGKPLPLTVGQPDGSGKREISVTPYLEGAFGGELSLLGIVPRPMISTISDKNSSAKGKILPGDVITAIEFEQTKDLVTIDSADKLRETIASAGTSGQNFSARIARGGKELNATDLSANIRIGESRRGLGVGISADAASAVVGRVVPGSPAAEAGIEPGSTLTQVGTTPVANLFEFRRAVLTAGAGALPVTTRDAQGKETKHTLTVSPDALATLAATTPGVQLALDERIEPRKTANLLTAVKWGVAETRDLIVQGYVTLKRVAERSVPASNMNGPIGIFHIGGMIATQRTGDWTLWFLAMISANLAVVNFLPIPIVDGGLFLFLIVEKIMGRPLSPKTQQIIQLAGIALLLSVFLFVTYNDIARIVRIFA